MILMFLNPLHISFVKKNTFGAISSLPFLAFIWHPLKLLSYVFIFLVMKIVPYEVLNTNILEQPNPNTPWGTN